MISRDALMVNQAVQFPDRFAQPEKKSKVDHGAGSGGSETIRAQHINSDGPGLQLHGQVPASKFDSKEIIEKVYVARSSSPVRASLPRGPERDALLKKQRGSVKALERRLSTAEALLKQAKSGNLPVGTLRYKGDGVFARLRSATKGTGYWWETKHAAQRRKEFEIDQLQKFLEGPDGRTTVDDKNVVKRLTERIDLFDKLLKADREALDLLVKKGRILVAR